MWLADAIFRGGHLSEQALAEVCLTGERPAHLDRCDICAARAVELSRWFDDVRTMGLEEADAAFPAERLAAQETQILRRLEQVDRPARVIAFPGQARSDQMDGQARGIRPAWVAFAAAAGLVLGVFGGQFSARLSMQPSILPTPPATQQSQSGAQDPIQRVSYEPPSSSLLDLDEFGRARLAAQDTMDQLTPRSTDDSHRIVLPTGRR